MTLAPGTRIGPYEITGSLGAGGMGEVLRARDSRLGRDVAIKILPEQWLADPERSARFDREARVLALLNHPHVGAIYGLEENGGRRALVLELIDGPTLAVQLERCPLSVGRALELGVQIASALEAAHERGIVHRDLKPGNVLLAGAQSKAKVVDFGLAKESSRQIAAVDSASPTVALEATRAGTVMGTAAYMSPEQARGDEIDARTDVWAFGCVLYEMLTGRSPFDAATLPDTLAAIVSREPDWAQLPAATPTVVARLLRRCLAKDRHERLRDIGDARLMIEDARRDSSPAALAPAKPIAALSEPSHRSRRSMLVVIAASLVLGAIAGWLVRSARQSSSTAGVPSSAGPELRLEITTPATSDPLSLAISPDGSRLAFVASQQGRPMLWLRSLETGVAEPIAGTSGAESPFWSPDGTALGFFADNQLQRVDIGVGSVRVLAPAIGARGGAWSSEGVIVFQPTLRGPLSRVSAQGGPVTEFEEGIAQLGDLVRSHARYAHFLPGGKHFLYWHWAETGEHGNVPAGIGVASLDGTLRRHLVDDAAGAVYNSGHLLFVKGTTLLAQPFDLASLTLSGSPFPVAAGIRIDPLLVTAPLSATATGPIVYRAGAVARRQFVWVDRSGAVLATVGEAMPNARSPSLSPDGRSIVFDGDGGSWLMDVARGIASRLHTSGLAPLWSRDGKRIALSGGGDIRVVPVAGDDPEVLVQHGRNLVCTDWSADERLLLCQPFFDGPGHLLVMPLDGGEPIRIGGEHTIERDAQFSPDGNWIAYMANDSGRPEVYLQRLGASAGPRVQVSSAGGGMPRFRADGREIFYVGLDGKLMAVTLGAARDGEALEAGTPTALFDARIGPAVPPNSNHLYVVAPDGQRFLLSRLLEEVPPPVTVIVNWKPRT